MFIEVSFSEEHNVQMFASDVFRLQSLHRLCFSQATGAPTMVGGIVQKPSFVLIDVQGSLVVTYSYVLEGKVREDGPQNDLSRT